MASLTGGMAADAEREAKGAARPKAIAARRPTGR
jgi:hypothetical protein